MSPLCSAASTTTGMCVMITTTLNRIVAGRKRASQRTVRKSNGCESSTPRHPGRRAEQQQRRREHRVHEVLDHVHREQVSLAEVVDGPAGGHQQREQTGREADHLQRRDDRGLDRRETGTDPDDGDRVGRAQQPDEEPHLRMRLERGEGNRSHS